MCTHFKCFLAGSVSFAWNWQNASRHQGKTASVCHVAPVVTPFQIPDYSVNATLARHASLCREPTSFWQSEETWNWVSTLICTRHGQFNFPLMSHSLSSNASIGHPYWSSVVTLFAPPPPLLSSWLWSGSRNQCLCSQKEVFHWNSLLVSRMKPHTLISPSYVYWLALNLVYW